MKEHVEKSDQVLTDLVEAMRAVVIGARVCVGALCTLDSEKMQGLVDLINEHLVSHLDGEMEIDVSALMEEAEEAEMEDLSDAMGNCDV